MATCESRATMNFQHQWSWYLRDRAMSKMSTVLLSFLITWGATPLLHASDRAMPASVHIGMTDGMGPIFVNEKGFTLYSSRYDDKAYQSNCNDDRYTRV